MRCVMVSNAWLCPIVEGLTQITYEEKRLPRTLIQYGVLKLYRVSFNSFHLMQPSCEVL